MSLEQEGSALSRLCAQGSCLLGRVLTREQLTEVLRYLVTGCLNAVLTFLVFIYGLKVIRIHYLLALIASFCAGIVFTYVLHLLWVFRPQTPLSQRQRFLRHSVPNALTFAGNLAGLYILVEYLGGDPFWCQVLLMFVVVTLNFLNAKFWAFRR